MRTLNDYVFIALILFDKNIIEIYNILLLLFPLFNSPNHLNNKRNPFLLLGLSSLIFSIIFIYQHGFDPKIIYILVGLFFLTLISYAEVGRTKIINDLFNIFESIDKITGETSNSLQLPKIYNKVIESLENILTKVNSVEMIACFVESEKTRELQIRSTSQLILKYDIKNLEDASKSNEKSINIPVIIDDKVYKNTLYIRINKYIFLLIFSREIQSMNLLYLIITDELIKPILLKITKILDFEDALNKRKYTNLKKLNAELHYVNHVVQSIHFLKNKFSPIKSYFQLLQKLETVDIDKKEQLLEIIQETKERALISLHNIETKTLQVLDKTNSPFASYEMEKIKLKHIYMLIMPLWLENFSETDVIVNCSKEDMDKTSFKLNRNLLEFFFTDIIENIRKYSSGKQSITYEYGSEARIIFKNTVHEATKKKTELKELINNFNRADRLEINRRNSFGLVHILELSDILHIHCKLSLEDEKYFTTTLTLGRDTDEKNTYL
ncbi:hypothetical protein [Sulfuricurvum kujiense]|uniref:hypothetical protein n=1 Tax=Sulfuricurvum kujiense TaxID=148813 RepID=UPI001248BB2C|nr:hypothetical protein [Sulfuricurvum kujiense]